MNDALPVVGRGYSYEDLSVGFRFRTHRRTLNESDLSSFVNLTWLTQVVAQHSHELMNQAQWQRLERWLHLFPREVIDDQPDLLLIEVWLKYIRQQLSEVPALLDRVESLLRQRPSEEAEQLRGEIESRRSALLYWNGDLTRSLRMAQQALEKVPFSWWYVRGTRACS